MRPVTAVSCFLIAALCAIFAFVEPTPKAEAQQVASQYTCVALLDGGTTAVCGTFPANYQPLTGTCEVVLLNGDKSSAGGTVNLLATGDGVHYGTIADAGYSWVVVANGDGGPVASPAVAFNISPTDPWLGFEVQASGIAQDAGTASTGALNCQLSVINSQTLHSVRPTQLKAAKRVQ